jgi:hypothetical protein
MSDFQRDRTALTEFDPASVSVQLSFTLAIIGIFAMITKPYRLQVAEHAGIFAGSLLHRGDWDHE